MKKLVLFLCFLVVFAQVGLSAPSVQAATNKTVVTAGNWENPGLFWTDTVNYKTTQVLKDTILGKPYEIDGWIYYLKATDNPGSFGSLSLGQIYRMKSDGSGATKLSDDSVSSFAIADGLIYYAKIVNQSGDSIIKMNLDGSSKQVVSNTSTLTLNVIDGWIYYSDKESGRIYKMKIDGSGAEPYSSFPVDYSDNYFIDAYGDYLFYTEFDYNAQTSFAVISKKGSKDNHRFELDSYGTVAKIDDSALYFDMEDYDSNQRNIYKISLDGKSRTPFSKQPIEGDFVSLEQDGFLYRTADNNHYKILLDGTLKKNLKAGAETSTTTSSSQEIMVTIDGKTLAFPDQAPVEQNGSVLVPMRAIFEALNVKIDWDSAKKIVTGSADNLTITLQIGSTTATINDKQVTLNTAPIELNDRTLVPARFVAEALGAKVDWDSNTKTVIITTTK
ncbi:DUF5050 domain-containing protein [Paenibacillus albiflavus]|uniref:DUF5050 domain-containing protein n=1 Tax=Paenibacillus albiflavus TaxID=2545760 RepID=A0A4R4EJJ1_9BACL|nr:stalk domain-containing protein [Paenibacillus albiflavus]TCZ78418.1 DUF5050 domain-containing protein [Paenibacillus albiflavus]